jgi:hypothetical protein
MTKESMRPTIFWGSLGLNFLFGFSGSGLIPDLVMPVLVVLLVAVSCAGHLLGIHSFHSPRGFAQMMGSFLAGAATGAAIFLSR